MLKITKARAPLGGPQSVFYRCEGAFEAVLSLLALLIIDHGCVSVLGLIWRFHRSINRKSWWDLPQVEKPP